MKFTFNKKTVLIYGGLFFLIQCIFAIVFYRERLFTDCSYYLLNTINSGWFCIMHQRFILGLAELLPFIGSHLGLPLKALLILFSLNNVLFFGVMFLIMLKRNDLPGALAMTALLAFATLNLFVAPIIEIWYGAAFAILLYSILQKELLTKMDYLWIALLEITVLFSHPENFILIGFFTLLDIQKKKAFTRLHAMMVVIIIACGIFKYLTLDSYEGAKVGWDVGFNYLKQINGSWLGSIGLLLIHYYWVLLLLIFLTCINYIITKQYFRGVIVFFTFVAMIALVNSVEANNVYSLYGSVMYLPIVSIAVVPFFYDTFRPMKDKTKTIAFVLFVLVIGYRFYKQPKAISSWTARVGQLERIISASDKEQGSKFMVDSKKYAKYYSKIEWSYPMETLLLSAERGNGMARSIITDEDNSQMKSTAIFSDTSIVVWRQFDIKHTKDLNPKYFRLQSGVYKPLDFKE